jgi:nucleolar protein 12
LPKAARKAAKAADPERVARRLAKKKARNVLQVSEQKDRLRVRKKPAEHKGGDAAARQKKTRVRSERSAAKRNTKK